jgi:phosphoglycerate kinase
MNYDNKKVLTDLTDLANQKVLVRVDFNVPLKNGVITDDNRIKAALPTIKELIKQNAKVILFSHLSRIKTEEDKQTKSLAPIAVRLSELLNQEVIFVPHTRGVELETAINNLTAGQVLVVENTRFEDVVDGQVVKNESKNNPELGKY